MLSDERLKEIEWRCDSVSETHNPEVREEFNYWALDDLRKLLSEVRSLRKVMVAARELLETDTFDEMRAVRDALAALEPQGMELTTDADS